MGALAGGVALVAILSTTSSAGEAGGKTNAIPMPAPLSKETPSAGATDPRPAPSDAAQALDSGCGDQLGCMWYYNDYVGEKRHAYPWQDDDGWLGYAGYSFASVKNRFNNRRLRVGNAFVRTACLNPGGERPNLAVSDRFEVGTAGSTC